MSKKSKELVLFQIAPPIPMWRPNVGSLDELVASNDLKNEETDDSCLGNASLFSPFKRMPDTELSSIFSSSSASRNDDYNEVVNDEEYEKENRKRVSYYKYKRISEKEFIEQMHPSIGEMVEMAERCGVRYRTVFENFAGKRRKLGVKCAEDDNCQKVAQFLLRENEALGHGKVGEEVRRVLEDSIETHLLSRKRFSLGYVHLIMEKTNLPPSYIRCQYDCCKKRLLTQNRPNTNMLPVKTVRQLEEAYLAKKYKCTSKEWSSEELEWLAARLKLREKQVSEWMEMRSGAVLGFRHDAFEFRRAREVRSFTRLPLHKTAVMNEEFDRIGSPSVEKRKELAERLQLTETQVKNYFSKRRIKLNRIATKSIDFSSSVL
ncbi:unnamed protein product [Caenorhabditis sp. 36 PRJEB53466]|nr:unnamed protein product [Caenorhabditis sp. 36 PRJEB53466]